MGTWGAGLYENDAAADLRASFAELARIPGSDDELLELVIATTPALKDATDEDHPSSWLAVADLFHRYGIHNAMVLTTAGSIVTSGADLEMARSLDMDEADLKRRARSIASAAERWQSPHPKPRKRRVLKAPQPHLLRPGAALAFPSMGGNAIEANLPPRYREGPFEADGYGAFFVMATGRRFGFYPTYLVARIHLRAKLRPTVSEIEDALISGIDVRLPGIPIDPAVKVVMTTTAELRTLEAEIVETWPIDRGAVAGAFPDRLETIDDPSWSLSGLMRPYSTTRSILLERAVAMKKLPLRRFLASPAATRRAT